MDPKFKRRFYEPLVLLRHLSQSQGERIEEESSDDLSNRLAQQIRRDVLCQLCKICDFTKGGETVTAMTLQRTPQGPVYWVSIPDKYREKIKDFLQGALSSVHDVVSQSPTDENLSALQSKLTSEFVVFAVPRLKATRKLLQRAIERAAVTLSRRASANPNLSTLRAWLEDLQDQMSDSDDLHEQCQMAYEKVRTAEMSQIKDILDHECTSGHEEGPILVRHFLGRMASSVRAAKILVQAGQRQAWLFEGYTIKTVTCGQDYDGPNADRKLTLYQILHRMMSKNDKRLPGLAAALNRLDTICDLTERVRKQYRDRNFRPKVHAEIALLEEVHARDIEYYDDDKYLACSKGACFCCYHYISRHPGRFVRPPSHNKIWLNWGVPSLEGETFRATQREVLMAVNNDVRDIAIKQILTCSGSRIFHPDSTTGVTKTSVPWFNTQLKTFGNGDATRSRSALVVRVSESISPYMQSEESGSEDSDHGGVSLISAQVSAFRI